MAKNDSDPENLNDDKDNGLEGLLGDFSDLLGDDFESSGELKIDHDGMALSEILGDDVSHDDRKERPLEPETVDETEDYASFLKDFDVLGSEETLEPGKVTESADEEVIESAAEEVASSDEDSVDIDLDFSSLTLEEGEDVAGSDVAIVESEAGADEGYAAILGELDGDSKSSDAEEPVEGDVLTLDDEEPGELSFAGLDTADESVSDQDETTVESVADDMGEPEGEVNLDLGLGDTDVEAPEADEEPAIIIPSSEEEEEEDFLGLTDSGGKEQEKPDFLDVDTGVSADVLFEGVEMDFDEQALMVTRAELLLAQKKKDEAARLFKEVAEKKGKTFWVEKRLQQLS